VGLNQVCERAMTPRMGVPAGHEVDPRWTTDGMIDVGIGERHAPSGQGIDVWR